MRGKAVAWALWGCAIVGAVWLALTFLSTTPIRPPRPAPTPTVMPTSTVEAKDSRYLYVLSQVPDQSGGPVSRHVTRFDPTNPGAPFTIDTGIGTDVDAAVSPDGTRLYVAAVDSYAGGTGRQDYVTTYDSRTGAQIWRVGIANRVMYHETGPSTLAISPDGRTLYVYSYDPETRQGHVDYWLQMVDTATGRVLPTTVDLRDCGTASMRVLSRGHAMYLVCFSAYDVRFVNLDTRETEQTLSLLEGSANPRGTGIVVGSALSSESGRLFVLTSTFSVAMIDVSRRVTESWTDLPIDGDRVVSESMLAVSADGRRLAVVDGIADRIGGWAPGDLHVYDTSAWSETKRVALTRLLGRLIPTAPPDGQEVYAVALSSDRQIAGLPSSGDSLVSVSLTDGRITPLVSYRGEAVDGAFLGP